MQRTQPLTIEIHKNNIDNSRVTNKQNCKKYFPKSFYQTKLTFSELLINTKDLKTFSREIVPDNNSFSLRCKVIINLY